MPSAGGTPDLLTVLGRFGGGFGGGRGAFRLVLTGEGGAGDGGAGGGCAGGFWTVGFGGEGLGLGGDRDGGSGGGGRNRDGGGGGTGGGGSGGRGGGLLGVVATANRGGGCKDLPLMLPPSVLLAGGERVICPGGGARFRSFVAGGGAALALSLTGGGLPSLSVWNSEGSRGVMGGGGEGGGGGTASSSRVVLLVAYLSKGQQVEVEGAYSKLGWLRGGFVSFYWIGLLAALMMCGQHSSQAVSPVQLLTPVSYSQILQMDGYSLAQAASAQPHAAPMLWLLLATAHSSGPVRRLGSLTSRAPSTQVPHSV